MAPAVVVLGAGYGGAATVTRLQRSPLDLDLTWLSKDPHHFVRHESHRLISDPEADSALTIPISAIAEPSTRFIRGTVTRIDAAERTVSLANGDQLSFDYLVYALGSEPADFGIPGIAEYAQTLNGRRDALDIHEAVVRAAREATPGDPASIVIGGAGLSGVQVAGELARLAAEDDLPLDIHLVEARDRILPDEPAALSRAVEPLLAERDIDTVTGQPVESVTRDAVETAFDERYPADVAIWTGGITGPRVAADGGLAADAGRLRTTRSLRTSDDRVFAVGDAAVIAQEGGPVPPTAQAAWQAASVVAGNIARSVRGRPLEAFDYRSQGTLLSVGEAAVAHDVALAPVQTITGFPAVLLKKGVAARWIASLTSWGRAMAAWRYL